MNRNLFASLVLLFCIILVTGMASCERRSGMREPREIPPPVVPKNCRVILTEITGTAITEKTFRCRTIPYDSITHFVVVPNRYRLRDTLLVTSAISFR